MQLNIYKYFIHMMIVCFCLQDSAIGISKYGVSRSQAVLLHSPVLRFLYLVIKQLWIKVSPSSKHTTCTQSFKRKLIYKIESIKNRHEKGRPDYLQNTTAERMSIQSSKNDRERRKTVRKDFFWLYDIKQITFLYNKPICKVACCLLQTVSNYNSKDMSLLLAKDCIKRTFPG